MIRVEDVGVIKAGFVVVQAPAVDDDSGAFGNEFAVDPVVWSLYQRVLLLIFGADGTDGNQLTISCCMGKCQGHGWPPPHGLFDNSSDIRQVLVIRPDWCSILSYHGVHLGLCFLENISPFGHGVEEREDDRARRIRTPFHQDAPDEVKLVPSEAQLFVLVENNVHE